MILWAVICSSQWKSKENYVGGDDLAGWRLEESLYAWHAKRTVLVN